MGLRLRLRIILMRRWRVGWGWGTDHLHAIETDANMSMRMDLLEEKIDELYADGQKIAFVIATFGSTDAFGVDDITSIREMINRKSAEYDQVCPQLHIDAAVGWNCDFAE